MTEQIKIVAVALMAQPYSTLHYQLPHWLPDAVWQVGVRVAVPLGARGTLRAGIITQRDCPSDVVPEGVELKSVLWPLEQQPLVGGDYLEMVRQLALRQMVSTGHILGILLPSGLRSAAVRLRVRAGGKPRTLRLRDILKMADSERAVLASHWMSGRVEVLEPETDEAENDICHVTQDPPWPVRPAAKKQIELLEYLWENGPLSRRRLVHDLGTSAQTPLVTLAERGLVHVGPLEAEAAAECACGIDTECHAAVLENTLFELTEPQKEALAQCTAAVESDKPETRLLFGITGSGKTAVYLELARACIEQGLSVMLLAPEVALACKLYRDVQTRFPGIPVVLYHGYQPAQEREQAFLNLAAEARKGGNTLIIGTRSALFLPVARLGVVVLDEEHDASFKQDERLSYQAKEVAWFRVAQHKGALVLGSATPDVKTFHAVREGHMPGIVLNERVGGGTLPTVELVDIKDHSASESILAPQTLARIKETVQKGEQAVILLNRRGYAPLMYCLDCGTVARCPSCEIGLTYHKGRERLVCHYCGHSVPFPSPCSKCKGVHYLPMGEGTEKMEETLSTLLPHGKKVLRLDRDSVRRPGRMEEILAAFAREESNILVGTQMLSKGHHFPSVTLAVVADGDIGLNMPDYRATERTFQLLVQAAGRAGRGERPGNVLIQTRDPKHYCWDFIRDCDYEGFFERELDARRKRRYPPFVKLALIRLSYPVDWLQGQERVNALAMSARASGRELGVSVLGPAPAPLPILRGRRRFQCLLKSAEWKEIRMLFHAAKQAVPASSKLRLSLDLDPVNML
ncbi:replication restart helicase PriA [Oleidesulfovibrio sp.]|uniref:replication restart helicase PriA n=1 Tax=Oleidesulfovibrio sp. TaxID=2909707 RepID=UPI003A8B520C